MGIACFERNLLNATRLILDQTIQSKPICNRYYRSLTNGEGKSRTILLSTRWWTSAQVLVKHRTKDPIVAL